MICQDIDSCFREISDYFGREKMGFPLIVNSESYTIYHEIMERLEADESKNVASAWENCAPNELPDLQKLEKGIYQMPNVVLLGISQACMLRSEQTLKEHIGKLANKSIQGYAMILLEHCEPILKDLIKKDLRLANRIVFVESKRSDLPRIKIAKKNTPLLNGEVVYSPKELLRYLIHLTDEMLQKRPQITMVTNLPIALFKMSMYGISEADGVYESIKNKYSDLGNVVEKAAGTEEQWYWIGKKLQEAGSFSDLICQTWNSTENLGTHIDSVYDEENENKKWLLWLALKVFGSKENSYLQLVLNESKQYSNFERDIVMKLLDLDYGTSQYTKYYMARKKVMDQLPENLALVHEYCVKSEIRSKNGIYYLTDSSEEEKHRIFELLETYDYSEEEILKAMYLIAPRIGDYLEKFQFDATNLQLTDADAAFRNDLTEYFYQYKLQKLTNKIKPNFLQIVNDYAVMKPKPIYKIQPRSSYINQLVREEAEPYFFDALGVEYLSYIQKRCKQYGLVMEVKVARCNLPSITMLNKEFEGKFPVECKPISELDELKHHSQKYNYQETKEPVHLYEELEIIDKELKKIYYRLLNEKVKKIAILSDHGASRLAVIYGHENNSKIQLEEKGIHSGRCCPVKEDPNIPQATYENGYAILGNYERFKGSRKANVEVHGGASLEEVLVPIITLTRKTDRAEYYFENDTIELKQRQIASICLFCTIPMKEPKICVNGIFYQGKFGDDKKHAIFSMPELKRSRELMAEIYEGDSYLGISLPFRIKKLTAKENDLLGI